jgi:hypothetical protein
VARLAETDFGEAPDRCSFCGLAASAFWAGHVVVSICPGCAVNILPALIADSIPYATRPHLDGAVARAVSRYWRAAAYRLQREARRHA